MVFIIRNIILLFIIAFMQYIYPLLRETNHISSVSNVVDVLWLLCMLHVTSFPTRRFSTFTLVLSAVCA